MSGGLWSWRRRDRELDEEIQAHLRMAVEARIARGEDPAAAAREARREFGNVTRVREITRSMWAWSWTERWLQDVRYGLRGLLRTPGFTVVTVLSLAVGVGATATAFTWIDSFLLRPFPGVRAASRLVAIHATDSAGQEYNRISYPQYQAWRRANTLAGLAVASMGQMSLRAEGAAEREWVQLVSANYFDVVGVRAALGRTFSPDEDERAAPVAVISDRLWRRRFRGDSSIVGRAVTLNGQGLTVIGVAPPGFHGTVMGVGLDVWAPVRLVGVIPPGNASLTTPGWLWLSGIGRLRPGATPDQAGAELGTMGPLDGAPRVIGDGHAVVRSISREELGRMLYPLLSSLLFVAIAILIVACTNTANLLVVRGISRSREIGIRQAIGASRGRLLTQLLIESALITGLAAVIGSAMVLAGRSLLGRLMPPLGVPTELESRLDGRLISVLFGLALGATTLSGLVPAFRAIRGGLVARLREAVNVGDVRSRLRTALVVAQVAVSALVLVTAGLFFRSWLNARAFDPGFRDPRHLLLVSADFALANGDDRKIPIELADLMARVRRLPGVAEASYTTSVPLNLAGGLGGISIRVPGYEPAAGEPMIARQAAVGAGYFSTLGEPLIRGRDFEDGDRAGATRVVVVDESFARRYLAGRNPVGLTIEAGGRSATIVGVARNTKLNLINEPDEPLVYLAHTQSSWPAVTLVVRTVGDPRSLIEPIRRSFASTDADLPALDPRTMEENMVSGFFVQSVGARVLGALGAVVLLLAAIGLYGVLSHIVTQRSREIGVRVALGASRWRIAGMMLRRTYAPVLAGIALGSSLALLVGRLVSEQLFGIRSNDPLTFALVGAILAGVAAAASLVPVRRATRVDPVTVLRLE